MVQVEDDPVYEEKREMLQNKLNELHQNFQGRLDYLYTRFQRDWLNHPKNKGTSRINACLCLSQLKFPFSCFGLYLAAACYLFTYLELSNQTPKECGRHVAYFSRGWSYCWLRYEFVFSPCKSYCHGYGGLHLKQIECTPEISSVSCQGVHRILTLASQFNQSCPWMLNNHGQNVKEWKKCIARTWQLRTQQRLSCFATVVNF